MSDLKVLIVDDDFVSRNLIQFLLKPYARCEIAVNGKEALEQFKCSLEGGEPYDLICLDIMMPEMDGQEVLKHIREVEAVREIIGNEGVKVVMTTALKDFKNISQAFKSQCEAYLVKPIRKAKLFEVIENLITDFCINNEDASEI